MDRVVKMVDCAVAKERVPSQLTFNAWTLADQSTTRYARPRHRRISRAYIAALWMGVGAFTSIATPARAAGDGINDVVLKNLCTASEGDPLPQLGGGLSEIEALTGKPRTHPYLFFSSADRERMRDLAKVEPYASVLARLQIHAEECLREAIPAKARVLNGIKEFQADGSYNPAYLRNDYDDLYRQSYLVKDVIPTLGLAWQLTGDKRYGSVGKAWLMDFATRPQLVRKERATDFDAANMLFGLSLGYDWLAELLSKGEREKVLSALKKIGEPMAVAAQELLASSRPNEIRGILGNNHTTRTHGMFGLASLGLIYEVPEAKKWLDLEVRLNRDRLLPSAWAPDGEYIDAWDHFDASLEDSVPFLVALCHLGVEDLFNNPRLRGRFRGISRYWLFGLENYTRSQSSDYAWLAVASHVKDPVAQWIVARDGNLSRVDPIWAYLLYDPTVKAAAPIEPKGSVYWPYSGMVKICTSWNARGLMLPFRCGPEIGKDLGDQNGFRFYAYGEWLLPRLADAHKLPSQPTEFTWDLWAWFRGSPAQNVVVIDPDGIGDLTGYETNGRVPLNSGIQYAEYPPMKGRQYDRQWLSGPAVPKRGELRTVQFADSLSYVCGEAHRAYISDCLGLWIRHILFVAGRPGRSLPYFIVCDELRSNGGPRTFAWQLHSGCAITMRKNAIDIVGKDVVLNVRMLEPTDGVFLEKETPAPIEKERTQFIECENRVPVRKYSYLCIFIPRLEKDLVAAPDTRLVEANGGVAAEVEWIGSRDLVLFRNEDAKSVTAERVTTTGSAALLRTEGAGAMTLYELGKK